MPNFIPYGDPGLFDEFVQDLDVAAFETPLLRVGKIVRWELFEPIVKAAVSRAPKGPGGRRRFHPLLMFKVLVLQRLHGLADDATGFQITDRKSFRAFLGLTPGDAVPDGQTISDFRAALIDAKAIDRLLATFLEHLQKEHGLALATQGVMVDASFAEVPRQRNSREENATIKAGAVPQVFQDHPKIKAHKDLDARWTKQNHETYYGDKDHVKVDVRDKLILKAVVTAAHVHDSQALDELIEEGDVVVYADSAYQSAAIDAALAAKNIEPQINEKGTTRGHPLTEAKKARNREKSRTRSRVEHVFAQMSGSMKALYQRCIGMARNAACLKLTNLVYNLLRFEQIQRLQLNRVA
ncbi:MAG: IS5 family transposase [Chthoniobacteraceae bacterium]